MCCVASHLLFSARCSVHDTICASLWIKWQGACWKTRFQFVHHLVKLDVSCMSFCFFHSLLFDFFIFFSSCCCLLLASVQTFAGLNTHFSVVSIKTLPSTGDWIRCCLVFLTMVVVVSMILFTGVATFVIVMMNEWCVCACVW